ncbi:MAG: hypothetical protein ACTSRC_18770 [Candidatus Helarchaeota archaeon]
MVIEPNTILIAIIFLIGSALVIWILPGHRFQTFVWIAIYIAAILPNFLTIGSLDDLIMAPFDSIFIYILFSLYIVFLLVRWLVPKDILGRVGRVGKARLTVSSNAPEGGAVLVGKILEQVKKDIEQYQSK